MSLMPGRVRVRKPKPKKSSALTPAQKRSVKAMIRAPEELKYHLSSAAATIIGITPVNASCTNVPQGATDTNRVGDTLWIHNIDCRFLFTIDSAATGDTPQFVRLILYQWHPTIDTAGAFPAASTILQNGFSGGPDALSHYNHDQRHNYKILRDTNFVLMPPGGFSATTEVFNCCTSKMLEWKVSKGFNRAVQYVAGSTTNGSNQVFLMCLSNIATANSHSGIAYSIITNFSDS